MFISGEGTWPYNAVSEVLNGHENDQLSANKRSLVQKLKTLVFNCLVVNYNEGKLMILLAMACRLKQISSAHCF